VELKKNNTLRLKKLGIDTSVDPILYLHKNCHVCRSEGFESKGRILVILGERSIIATLNIINSDILKQDEASLSEYAWKILDAKENGMINLSHPQPIESLSYIHAKIYNNELTPFQIQSIIKDTVAGRLSEIHLAAFLTATTNYRINKKEILELTKAMAHVGEQLKWSAPMIVDKHCVGGLPGNRTSLILVPIVAAFGLIIPKMSSRAITSPAGTADTMEVLAPVSLTVHEIRKVVEKENGCIVWGGTLDLSPADDILLRIQQALDFDSEGQIVASILSKKIAAGSTHTLIDIPVGPTAKIRSIQNAKFLLKNLEEVGKKVGITIKNILSDGSQPIGRGIGPALEARDVLEVLQCKPDAPQDLREKSLILAGHILEFSSLVSPGTGKILAQEILDSGQAWKKFQAICLIQGYMKEPQIAPYYFTVTSTKKGRIFSIDNRSLAKIAKLAGAPLSQSAGVDLHISVGSIVEKNQPLFTIYSESKGVLSYTLGFAKNRGSEIIQIGELI